MGEPIRVDIVCPVYCGLSYIKRLAKTIKSQENIIVNKIVMPITDSNDNEFNEIIDFVIENKIEYFVVKKEDFSHSFTREKAILDYCNEKIVIMLSQDVILCNTDSIYQLAKSIVEKKSAYSYGRQICTNKSIEKYIRQKNYSNTSICISRQDVDRMGLSAFFSSDAFSAYDRDVFIKIGGYNGYNVMMNEDMLYSKFVLDNGYKKCYVSEAVVEHSHKYKLRELYKRYFETGRFFRDVPLFDGYKSTTTGFSLALYVFKEAIKHFDIPVLMRFFPDMIVRYFGMKNGRKGDKKQ